ncbi:MAG TPA: FtsX-like permease family protein [Terriglobia bacterium]|nr:FtsX-like permease family protein [Terriglobia bacterium]
MNWRRSDLPLQADPATRFLPWILGFLVYLSALMIGCGLMIDQMAESWQAGLAGNLTVELPIDPAIDAKTRGDRLNAAIDLVTATPGVTGATVLEQAELERLLRPWLGDNVEQLDVALPTMIAVTTDRKAVIDLADLQQRLTAIVAGSRVDNHGDWVSDALHFLHTLQALAAFLVLLVLTAAAATVVFVTRTGLAVHQPVIEILHLVGAQDSYIARQFQAQSFRVSLAGGIIGTLLAIGTLGGLAFALGRRGIGFDRATDGLTGTAPLLPAATDHLGSFLLHSLGFGIELTPWHWLAMAGLPLLIAFLAMLTARWTVLRSIHRVM